MNENMQLHVWLLHGTKPHTTSLPLAIAKPPDKVVIGESEPTLTSKVLFLPHHIDNAIALQSSILHKIIFRRARSRIVPYELSHRTLRHHKHLYSYSKDS